MGCYKLSTFVAAAIKHVQLGSPRRIPLCGGGEEDIPVTIGTGLGSVSAMQDVICSRLK